MHVIENVCALQRPDTPSLVCRNLVKLTKIVLLMKITVACNKSTLQYYKYVWAYTNIGLHNYIYRPTFFIVL